MTTVKALFQEPSYKEESLNIRIITSGFFKGLEVFATGKIITPDKHIITPYTSKTHPTRCVNYQGRGLAL